MSAFQLIMLGLGCAVGISAFWDKIKNFIPDFKVHKPKPLLGDDKSLCNVIVCWENLKRELHARGLNIADEELDKIFPLFISKVKDVENG